MIRLAFFILFFSAPLFAQTITGRVISIADGDTIAIVTPEKKQVKIRLGEIDAPERSQDFGERSKQSLSELIYGKDVQVTVESTDQYGRSIGKISFNGQDVNLEQIRRGMAWFYVQYGRDPAYRQAEKQARSQRVGLWGDANPTPPWEYRRAKKSGSDVGTTSSFLGSILGTTKAKVETSCGGKRYCKEMTSCDEAMMYLKLCGVTSLDGDGDGVPCAKLCK